MRKWVIPIMALGALLTVVGLAWAYSNGMASSLERAEREHGVDLPDTVSHVRCRGDAWGGFMGSGATTLFAVPAPDLAGLVKQLDVLKDEAVEMMPIADQDVFEYLRACADYDGSIVAESTILPRVVRSMTCRSDRGDTLSIRVWQSADDLLAVCMHTDWN